MKENDGLLEGQSELYMQSCEILIPKNAVKIGFTRSFELYKFIDEKSGEIKLGIRITSYHPGELAISKAKVRRLLQELEELS